MKIGTKGLALIQEFEGWSSRPYPDPATNGIPYTIGFGNTFYEDGTKVNLTDAPITKERGLELLKITLKMFEKQVDSLTRDDINQNQFDALCSFCYNVGAANLKISTLLKKVNINPNDESIALEFVKWNKANGKVLNGLTKRRQKEAILYFS